jgi:hypothetical protein
MAASTEVARIRNEYIEQQTRKGASASPAGSVHPPQRQMTMSELKKLTPAQYEAYMKSGVT